MSSEYSPPIMITDSAALEKAAQRWQEIDVIALDTEFIRTDTFYPILALIQLCDGETTWLVDPLALPKPQGLIDLLANPNVVKVLHSCSEDLETLSHSLGQLPDPLFDTQTAAAYCGLGFSVGYRGVVKTLAGVELDKHETRSDWLQRPLSASQLSYAAEDVHYLLPVYESLLASLNSQQRLSWVEDEMLGKLANSRRAVPPETYYTRVKGAWKLDRRGLAILQALSTWREGVARQDNRPRGRIIADKDLLTLSFLKPPLSMTQLQAANTLHPRELRLYGEKVLSVFADIAGGDDKDFPPLLPKAIPREHGSMLKSCRQLVVSAAQELDLAPEVLARKVDLEFLVRSIAYGDVQLPEVLASGWRFEAVGEALLSHASELQAAASGE
ncbi:MAG: ribonuclease D [Gammaproteobacteria bacterium]|nr:ribonuclease D [Gammaproteobacteria bacterium]MBQ0840203.1 ribonuclease D [Gammaproteobacteria bacterium]